VTESPRTFWLSSLTAMYQMIDTTPMTIVETVGVCHLGLTVPNVFGSAPQRAIDRLVRAVGRIVVCVEAAAELSTAMISSLSSGEPKTFVPSTLRTSSALSVRSFSPP
jgi:hypothetical protein